MTLHTTPFRISFPSAFYTILFVIVSVITCSSCSAPTPQARYLSDLIEPIQLRAETADTILISDVFYSESYDCDFTPHSSITIAYDSTTRRLVLSPLQGVEGLQVIEFRLGASVYKIPVIVSNAVKHVFHYHPKRGETSISVMGNFNGWNRTSMPLTLSSDGSVFSREVPLDYGRYEYKFVVDGREVLDPDNSVSAPNGIGGFNSILTIEDKRPKRYLYLLDAKVRQGLTELHFWYDNAFNEQPETKVAPPLSSEIIALIDNRAIPATFFKIIDQRVVLTFKSADLKGDHTVRVSVKRDGAFTPIQSVFLSDGKPLEISEGLNSASVTKRFRWNDATIYSIVTDRFLNGDPTNDAPLIQKGLMPQANYYGGDFAGIIKKLDEGYFDSLGVNTLWISPVNKNTDSAFAEFPPPHRLYSSYHGYWPTHHEEVEPRFGTLAQLKLLISKAERRKMRVLLDFVANHTHLDHPFYKTHPEWFGELDLPNGKKNIRLFNDYRLTTWFETYLPSFDYSKTEPLEAMTDNAIWWLKTTGAHGFRHDAVKHIPNEFWRRLTYKIKTEIELPEKRKVYQIGETFGDYAMIKSYVNNGQLDAQFNFTLYDASLYTFLTPNASFLSLSNELHKGISVYGLQNLMGTMIDSHDKVRFMAYADGDVTLSSGDTHELGWTQPPMVDDPLSYKKSLLFLAFIATLPGVPVLYYGDEIGLSGAADPDNRRPMRFADRQGLTANEITMLNETRALFRLRKAHSALRYGDLITLQADEKTFVYVRSDLNERVMIALNKTNEPVRRTISLPKVYKLSRCVDVFSSRSIAVENSDCEVTIPAYGYCVFQLY